VRRKNKNDTTPQVSDGTITGSVTSRRGFLAVAGIGAAGVALAACSNDAKTATTTGTNAPSTTTASTTPSTTAAGGATTTTAAMKNVDADTAAVAAGLEVLAVQTYGAALEAATAGKLGEVPPAVAEFVTTAKAHHEAALEKWNGVLKAAGKAEVTKPDAKLKPTVDAAFAKVTDVGGAAALALMLEQTAAATYQKVIPTLTSKDAINLAGSIQVIDAQHAAILLFVAGKYPVPDVFAKTDMAAA
jgi:rubrerythrin